VRRLGSGYQGEVYLIDGPDGALIMKRPSGRGALRMVRRAMLRREHAIYQRLQGIAGVPECRGLAPDGSLLLEFIEGRSLREAALAPVERERFFAALRELITAVHRAGVAHGDLKRKDNILVAAGNRPYLIDFGTAVSALPGAGFLRRFLFRQIRRMDLNAWVKLKYQRQGVVMDAADQAHYRPTVSEAIARVLRRAWRAATFRRWRKSRR
jgi:predicted Ser/Thr protein kinase